MRGLRRYNDWINVFIQYILKTKLVKWLPFPRNGHYQGYFCDRMHQDTIPEALSQKDVCQNDIPEPRFSGISFMRLDSTLLSYRSSFKQTI
jgi:hypothetical protein